MAAQDDPEWQAKLVELRTALGSTTTSDAELHAALESSDGNVSQAVKSLKAPRSATATPTQATSPVNPISPTTPQDPLVADLKVMFPALDTAIIALIVETHTPPAPGGLDASGHPLSEDARLDKCIGDLLAMSDPEYKPEAAHAAADTQAAHISLDEQFARSLAMQEQQIAGGGGGGAQQGNMNLPYQPRVRRSPAAQYESEAHGYAGQAGHQQPMVRPGGGRGGQQEPGVGDQFEEQFGKFAEAGKKTFDSLLTKARSKYQEFQDSQAQRQQQQQGGGYAQSQGPGQYGAGGATRSGQQHGGVTTTLSGLFSSAQNAVREATAGLSSQGQHDQTQGGRPASRDAYATGSYGAASGSGWGRPPQASSASMSANTGAGSSAKRWQPNDGYDDDPLSPRVDLYQPPSSTTSSFSIPSPPKAATPLPSGNTGALNVGGQGGPGTSPGSSKIDAAKLGMLPKKKVSLLSSSPSAAGGVGGSSSGNATLAAIPPASNAKRTGHADDADEEYTRSPFDE